MRCNRLTKMITTTAILSMIAVMPVSAISDKTFIDAGNIREEVKLTKTNNICKNSYIYSDSADKTMLILSIMNNIPDYSKDCIKSTDIVLYSGSINRIVSKTSKDAWYNLNDTNAIFGNLKGQLYGEYREKKNEIAIDSELRDDIFTITFLHEIGHVVDNRYDISEQLTDEMIENICEITGKYSPLNNSDHMDTPDEAAAELFMFCVTQPDMVKDILPDNLMWMIGGNANG